MYVHLLRRAVGAISNAVPDEHGSATASAVLGDGEFALWNTMPGRDRRHSLEVLERFDALVPGAPRAARAAALLHDVGKTASGLGWWGRVIATVVGARGDVFTRYHRHEQIGAEMLEAVSEETTIRLILSTDPSDPIAAALRRADMV